MANCKGNGGGFAYRNKCGAIIPFEIKLHSAPKKKDVPGLVSCMEDLRLSSGYVLYPGKEDYSLGNGIVALSVEKILGDARRIMSF